MGKMNGSAGSETIEVCNDGCGESLKSRPYMAMRHATLKLQYFDDLYSSSLCQDLGFRGEALFCLAHISKSLVVTVRFLRKSTCVWFSVGVIVIIKPFSRSS